MHSIVQFLFYNKITLPVKDFFIIFMIELTLLQLRQINRCLSPMYNDTNKPHSKKLESYRVMASKKVPNMVDYYTQQILN